MFQLLVLLFIIKLYARSNIFKYYFILTEDSYHLSIFVLQLINTFFWKKKETPFFGKISRGIFSSTIQNLVILCEENEVIFGRGNLKKILLRDLRYIICGIKLVHETYFYMLFY